MAGVGKGIDPQMALLLLSPMPLPTPAPTGPYISPAAPAIEVPIIPIGITTPVNLPQTVQDQPGHPKVNAEIIEQFLDSLALMTYYEDMIERTRLEIEFHLKETRVVERWLKELQKSSQTFVEQIEKFSPQDQTKILRFYEDTYGDMAIDEIGKLQRENDELGAREKEYIRRHRDAATLYNHRRNELQRKGIAVTPHVKTQPHIEPLPDIAELAPLPEVLSPAAPSPVTPQLQPLPDIAELALSPVTPQLQPLPDIAELAPSPVTPSPVVPQQAFTIRIPITQEAGVGKPVVITTGLGEVVLPAAKPIQVIAPPEPAAPARLTKSPVSPVLTPKLEVGTPVEQFIETIIFEQDADIAQEKEYLGYVKYLLDADNKYDIFARLHPEFTCENVGIRVAYIGNKGGFQGQEGALFYGNQYGAAIRITPTQTKMQMCITSAERDKRSIAIYLSYHEHANMIWIDTVNKIINRYDPQVPGTGNEQMWMDDGIRAFFATILPGYEYLGNTQEDFLCVQAIREIGRTHKADYFCQDYSLLYAERRAKGMSHEEAAFDLVAKIDDVLLELAELLRRLTYQKRRELGKHVPPKYLGGV